MAEREPGPDEADPDQRARTDYFFGSFEATPST